MSSAVSPPAADTTRELLGVEVDRVRSLLQRLGADADPEGGADGDSPGAAGVGPPPEAGPLWALATQFGLSRFERDVLALSVAVELDGGVAQAVASATGGDPYPSAALAMHLLGSAHWDALAPGSPLRSWKLVDLVGTGPLVTRSLVVDERVLHHLTGTATRDRRLAGVADPQSVLGELSPAQVGLVDDLAATLRSLAAPALVLIDGDDDEGRSAAARVLAGSLGLVPLVVWPAALPAPGPELEQVARLVDREAVLTGALVVIDGSGTTTDHAEPVAGLVRSLLAPVVVQVGDTSATERAATAARVTLARRVDLPEPADLREVWTRALGPELSDAPGVGSAIEAASQAHRIGATTVRSIAAEVVSASGRPDDATSSDQGERPESARLLTDLCRRRTTPSLEGMARAVEPRARWSDLVLPDTQLRLLREIAAQTRHRHLVHDEWGFAGPAGRGLGITAMFTGDSGTGKTLAAEVLAGEVGLSLLRIDLGAVVSKWVGETEKNLSRVFDEAERSGAVLLFDEADALFGKRGEVRHGNDRYANLEVSYLLARMETYRGLAILTTNLKANVDRAFLRRLRFVVHFPFPDEAMRARIWECSVPEDAPTEDLDPAMLARLNLSGGSIRSVAVSAAFAAAQDGTPITRAHVLRAAEVELAKADRSLTGSQRGVLS